MLKDSSRFRMIAQRAVLRYALFSLVIFGAWGLSFSGYSQTAEQNRKMARIEASYLTHLTKYIQWDSSTKKNGVKIIIHGDDPYKFYESLKYAIEVSSGGERIADFEIMHFTNDQTDLALKNIKEGFQILVLTKKSFLTAEDLDKIESKGLIVVHGEQLFDNTNAPIAFQYSQNRVRLLIDRKLLNQGGIRVSSKLANLRNAVIFVDK